MKKILDLLLSQDFVGAGNFTDIAKGKFSIPKNRKDVKKRIKWLLKK